jgi:hypothetical protein
MPEEFGWIADVLSEREALRASEGAWAHWVQGNPPDPVLIVTLRGALRGAVAAGTLDPKEATAFLVGKLREADVLEDWVWHEVGGVPLGTLRAIEAIRRSGCANMLMEHAKVVHAAKLLGPNPLAEGAAIADWLRQNGSNLGMATPYFALMMQADTRRAMAPSGPTVTRAASPKGVPAPAVTIPADADPCGMVAALVATGMNLPEALNIVKDEVDGAEWKAATKDGLAPAIRSWLVGTEVRVGGAVLTAADLLSRLVVLRTIDPHLADVGISALAGATVMGDLNLNSAPWLTRLPDNLTVTGALDCSGCRNLTMVGAGLRVQEVLSLGGCEGLETLSDGWEVGDLWLGGAVFLERLPAGLKVKGDLSMERCPSWDGIIPEDAEIGQCLFTDAFPCEFQTSRVGSRGGRTGGLSLDAWRKRPGVKAER